MSGVGQRTAELAVMTLTASRLFRGLSAIVGATYREFRGIIIESNTMRTSTVTVSVSLLRRVAVPVAV
jgi:hypothetical protein